MAFMGKELKDIVVTLPFADGSQLECGVFEAFEVGNKQYFALLPLKADKTLDFTQSYMLYRVEEDKEGNPVVMYIEDDGEYNKAADCFSNILMLKEYHKS